MLRILRKCFSSYASVQAGLAPRAKGLLLRATLKKPSHYTDQSKDKKDVKHSYGEIVMAHAVPGPPPGAGWDSRLWP